jgi:hypothetical protein
VAVRLSIPEDEMEETPEPQQPDKAEGKGLTVTMIFPAKPA